MEFSKRDFFENLGDKMGRRDLVDTVAIAYAAAIYFVYMKMMCGKGNENEKAGKD